MSTPASFFCQPNEPANQSVPLLLTPFFASVLIPFEEKNIVKTAMWNDFAPSLILYEKYVGYLTWVNISYFFD